MSSIYSIQKKREQIGTLAEQMISLVESGQAVERDCPVTHRFAKGCYLREIFMPAGTLIVGKIHATEHFNVILTGRVTVVTAEGTNEYEAPDTFVTGEGVQKVVFCHTDCVWQTIHVTELTNVEEIEKAVIVDSYDQLQIDSLILKLEETL